MGRAGIRERADRVREIPLEAVLAAFGAERDPLDQARWRTPKGCISVTPPKFMNWSRGEGGGGAIDLAMHLGEMDFLGALAWLEDHFPAVAHSPDRSSRPATPPLAGGLVLPPFDAPSLPRARRYLIEERHLPARAVDALFAAGTLRADARANAVFLMYAEDGRTIGAELRGTTARAWHSLARGSRRDRGYFSVPCPGAKQVVICESAIDAMSCACIHPDSLCFSTAGVRPNPRWLPALLESGYEVLCGFDADDAGDRAAEAMCTLHPTVRRLRPPLGDWNDVLRARG